MALHALRRTGRRGQTGASAGPKKQAQGMHKASARFDIHACISYNISKAVPLFAVPVKGGFHAAPDRALRRYGRSRNPAILPDRKIPL